MVARRRAGPNRDSDVSAQVPQWAHCRADASLVTIAQRCSATGPNSSRSSPLSRTLSFVDAPTAPAATGHGAFCATLATVSFSPVPRSDSRAIITGRVSAAAAASGKLDAGGGAEPLREVIAGSDGEEEDEDNAAAALWRPAATLTRRARAWMAAAALSALPEGAVEATGSSTRPGAGASGAGVAATFAAPASGFTTPDALRADASGLTAKTSLPRLPLPPLPSVSVRAGLKIERLPLPLPLPLLATTPPETALRSGTCTASRCWVLPFELLPAAAAGTPRDSRCICTPAAGVA